MIVHRSKWWAGKQNTNPGYCLKSGRWGSCKNAAEGISLSCPHPLPYTLYLPCFGSGSGCGNMEGSEGASGGLLFLGEMSLPSFAAKTWHFLATQHMCQWQKRVWHLPSHPPPRVNLQLCFSALPTARAGKVWGEAVLLRAQRWTFMPLCEYNSG